MDGKARYFDISDPFNPVQKYEEQIGSQVNMISQSWDGKRAYFSTSLLGNWDKTGEADEQWVKKYYPFIINKCLAPFQDTILLVNEINQFHHRLNEIGFSTTSTSQIIPVIIGNEKKTVEFSKFLMNQGIFAQAIRYPTVKKDQARIRISVSGWLSEKEIEYTMHILEKAKRRFNLN